MVASVVASVMVTDCLAVYIPAAGVKVGVAVDPAVTVIVKTLDVEDGYCGFAANVAVIEFAPETSDVPSTTSVQLPPLSVQLPRAFVPALKLTVPIATGGLST